MGWNFFSFLFTNEEGFVALNENILETNVINIFLLIGILLYANKISFSSTLQSRKQGIIDNIENSQKDVLNATNYFDIAENAFKQSVFYFQSWKSIYEKEKINLVKNKYKIVKTGLEENFQTSQDLLENFEKKAFLSLQRYILIITASRILRKFLALSEKEKSKLIETTISILGGVEK